MNLPLVRRTTTNHHAAGRQNPVPNWLFPSGRGVWRLATCAVLAWGLANPLTLRAASVLWNGMGFDQNWSSADNWSNNIAPAGPTDDVLFINEPPPASSALQGAINSIVDVNYTIGTLNLLSLNPLLRTAIALIQRRLVVGARTTTFAKVVERRSPVRRVSVVAPSMPCRRPALRFMVPMRGSPGGDAFHPRP